jgi:hypothetical protein
MAFVGDRRPCVLAAGLEILQTLLGDVDPAAAARGVIVSSHCGAFPSADRSVDCSRPRFAFGAAGYPCVTSSLCAANTPRTSSFSWSGTLKESRVRAGSATTGVIDGGLASLRVPISSNDGASRSADNVSAACCCRGPGQRSHVGEPRTSMPRVSCDGRSLGSFRAVGLVGTRFAHWQLWASSVWDSRAAFTRVAVDPPLPRCRMLPAGSGPSPCPLSLVCGTQLAGGT